MVVFVIVVFEKYMGKRYRTYMFQKLLLQKLPFGALRRQAHKINQSQMVELTSSSRASPWPKINVFSKKMPKIAKIKNVIFYTKIKKRIFFI